MRLRRMPTIIAVALAAAAIIFAGCGRDEEEQQTQVRTDTTPAGRQPDTSIGTSAETSQEHVQGRRPAHLPRLVDLGRGTCIPCKQMAPILEEIEESYRGKAIVEVIDLRDDPGAAKEYGIRLIPTQIFFDAAGEEVWRHEGFLARDAIIAKLTEMGVEPVDD